MILCSFIFDATYLNDLKQVLATPWEVVIFFDTIVFALTLYKAVEIWKTGPSSLFQVLVRDGKRSNLYAQTTCL